MSRPRSCSAAARSFPPPTHRTSSFHGSSGASGGKTIAGFAAFKNHLSYLPFSGSVIGQLADELQGCATTKSSVRFPVDKPLPKALVKKLIELRLADVAHRAR